MANNNKHTGPNVPALRFPEFSGEWEYKSLGEIGESLIGLTYSPSDVVKEGGTIVFRSSNIQDGVIDYGDLVRVSKKIKDSIITRDGDLLICARNGSTRLIGKNALLKKSDEGQTFGAFMMVFRSIDNRFVHQLLSTKAYSTQVSENLGARINQITTRNFAEYTFGMPQTSEEKEKIGTFLELINDRIETQSKIIEEQETLLRSLRHKLFNQCLDSHTQCRIGDILSIGSGKDYQHLREGEIPVYGTGGLISHVNESLYDGESVCIGRKGTINKPLYLSGRFWTVDTLFYTHSFNGILPRFCYHLFCTIDWLTYNEASGVPSLSKSTIEKILVSIPQIDIQKRIVQILDSIEEKINIDRNTLLDYQKQKIYLLSRMFI